MASLNFPAPVKPVRGGFPTIKFEHEPSQMQTAFYRDVWEGEGNVNLIAVAGSGKSTSIVNSLLYVDPRAYVTVLAFGREAAAEMRDKIEKTAFEHGVELRRCQAKTFHSLGLGALLKHFKKSFEQCDIGDRKSRRILKAKLDKQEFRLYAGFVERLVGFAKGEGVGTYLKEDTEQAWYEIIDHHDLELESEDADLERAVAISRQLLEYSCKVAPSCKLADGKPFIDFDDQIYLPLRWNLRLWQNDILYVDEAQDTNPCRRALARKALRPDGRAFFVGDPNQAIFGFTGATNDAMDIIKEEFSCRELPLTVSYRCPRVAEALVRPLVSHFSVFEKNAEGSILRMSVKKGVERLGPQDAVICRNTAPLVDLAFELISQGRGCVILGKDIGKQLVNLIEQQNASDIDNLVERLEAYRSREVLKLLEKEQEEKAEALNDRVNSVLKIVEGLREGLRTIADLCARIEGMFSDKEGEVLTLMTAHKSKGLEFPKVAILEPGLMPSRWARRDHQFKQEKNLQYVAWTRFQEELIFLNGADAQEVPPAARRAGEDRETFFGRAAGEAIVAAKQEDDDLMIPAHLRRTKQ